MKSRPRVDLTIYFKAFGLLVRHPSIFVMPLLAAVVELLLTQLSYLFTDPLGGSGAGIFQMLVQLVYLWAFGITIIQANAVWRGRRGAFDEAWDEGRAKFVGILFAAIGFQFVVWAASYIGSFAGSLGLVLGVVAALFLIYTIPAASIGGIPGTLALSQSLRAVRAAPIASLILALVFFVHLVRRRAAGITVSLDSCAARDLELRKRRSARDRAGLSCLSVCQAVRRGLV